ncbi:hypothetical protein ACSBR2_018389 [Camellia fascicularis]
MIEWIKLADYPICHIHTLSLTESERMMATVLEPLPPPPLSAAAPRLPMTFPSPPPRLANSRCSSRGHSISCKPQTTKDFAVPRRNAMALIFSSYILSRVDLHDIAFAQQSVVFREYIDTFDGYSFKYPQNWIQVREAGEKVLRQYLTEFMSTRLGVRRESNILSASSRVADDGRMYYQVEVNIKSYANNNELAVMPQDRVVRLEWDRRYLSVLGVENRQLYELRLQTPENVFAEEESDLRRVMDSFRVNKVAG